MFLEGIDPGRATRIKDLIANGSATFICPTCGKRTGWYRGVADKRAARVCEHKTPTGGRCSLSRRLLTDKLPKPSTSESEEDEDDYSP